jgi:autotransporter-associated beta strand protein
MVAFRAFPLLARFVAALVLVSLVLTGTPVQAASLFWDTNGTAAGSNDSTSGLWGVSNFWNTDSTGANGGSFQSTTSSADDLFISAASNATGANTISISGNRAANSLTFNNGTVTLAGVAAHSLTLGSGGLTMNSSLDGTLSFNSTLTSVILSGSQAWTNFSTRALSLSSATAVRGNATAGNTNVWTIGGPGTGAATVAGTISDGLNGGRLALLKTGSTTLTLTGTNTYTGDTTIRQGGIALTFASAGTDGVNRISSSSTLRLGDASVGPGLWTWTRPTLTATGTAGQANSQTFNGTFIYSGRNAQVTAGTAATGSMTIDLGAITAGSYATLNLTAPLSSGTIRASNSNNATGIIGTWFTTGVSGTQGTDWAMNDGTGKIVAYTGSTLLTGTLITSGSNHLLIDSTTTALNSGTVTTGAGTTDVNTIRITDPAFRRIALGGTLRLGVDGAIFRTDTTSSAGLRTDISPTSRIGGYIYPKFLIFSKSISQVSTTAKLDSLRFGRDWDS